MAITVNTRKYLASHQRSPRGHGGYSFTCWLRRYSSATQGE